MGRGHGRRGGRNNDGPPVSIVNAYCKHMTEKAMLVKLPGHDDMWIPTSQVHDDSEVYDDTANSEGTLVITAWIAEQKGLADTAAEDEEGLPPEAYDAFHHDRRHQD